MMIQRGEIGENQGRIARLPGGNYSTAHRKQMEIINSAQFACTAMAI